ncbi:MAG: serine/threonine protein kinase, partial [Polyangiaceae bacterium]|nr:serine/threonine protein kinase [Polyangiaceae bacterium]
MSQDSAPTMYPVSGEVLKSRYEIKDVLGEGGMGAVAKGWDRNLNRYVAVKFMSPALVVVPGAVERFIMEGKAAAQLEDTDHVVRFYDDGVLPNHTPFLVMEFLDGRDLSGLIEKEGIAAISVPRAIHFILQVLRGLQVAHAKGIIHRDIKPSNCFVVHREGEDDFIKIVDFGISKFQKESGQPSANLNLTKTNSALGTPLYMSPEQAKSPKTVDHRSDLYSVSCILYELLTGQTPYLSETGEFADILVKLLTQEPEPLAQLRPDLPPGLAEVVHTGLAKEREDR